MATTKSVQLAQLDQSPNALLKTTEAQGRLRTGYFSYTQAANGSIGDDVELIKLPAGRVRLLGLLSRVAASDKAASATLDVGWKAYSDEDGAAVVASQDGLAANADIASGPTTITPGANLFKEFRSRDGVVLNATFEGVAPAANDTLEGFFVYVAD